MASGLNWFSGLFLDSTPSVVAAVAIFTAIALFIVTILVSGGSATIGQKVGSAVLLLLVLLPSIGLSLFDITCLMRGGDESLCGILGWVKALLILLYTGLIGVMTVVILLYGKQLQFDGFRGSRSKFTDLTKAEFGDKAEQGSLFAGGMTELNEGFYGGSNVAALPAAAHAAAAAAAHAAVLPVINAAHPANAAANATAHFTDVPSGLGAYLSDDLVEPKKTAPLTAEAFFGGAALAPVSSMSAITAAMTPFAK